MMTWDSDSLTSKISLNFVHKDFLVVWLKFAMSSLPFAELSCSLDSFLYHFYPCPVLLLQGLLCVFSPSSQGRAPVCPQALLREPRQLLG